MTSLRRSFPNLSENGRNAKVSLRPSINSDAQTEEIIQKLQKQDEADRKILQNATMILHIMDFQKQQRRWDNRRLVQEILAEHSERHPLST